MTSILVGQCSCALYAQSQAIDSQMLTGGCARQDKDPNTEASDYKGAIVAGKFAFFDVALRDMFDNYLWKSLPQTRFRITVDAMQIRYFDTGIRFETSAYWPASFDSYTFHDYGVGPATSSDMTAHFYDCKRK